MKARLTVVDIEVKDADEQQIEVLRDLADATVRAVRTTGRRPNSEPHLLTRIAKEKKLAEAPDRRCPTCSETKQVDGKLLRFALIAGILGSAAEVWQAWGSHVWQTWGLHILFAMFA